MNARMQELLRDAERDVQRAFDDGATEVVLTANGEEIARIRRPEPDPVVDDGADRRWHLGRVL